MSRILGLSIYTGLGLWGTRSIHFYPDDGGGSGGGDDEAAKKAAEEAAKKAAEAADKKFSQKDVDGIVANKKREQDEKHLTEIQKLAKEKGISDERRKELEKRAGELEESLMSEKDRVKSELAKKEGEHKAKLEASETEKTKATNLFTRATIKRAIMDAALEHRVYEPTQLVDMLENRVKLLQADGTKGENPEDYVAVVEISEVDADTGKVTKKTLPIAKYVESLKGQKKYDNLFLSERVGGTGYRPTAGGGGAAGGDKDAPPVSKISRGLGRMTGR